MKLSDYRNALIKTADELDAAGLYDKADEIDKWIKEASLATPMIRALKSDDADGANKALFELVRDSKNPAQELQMTDQDFKDFAQFIKSRDLSGARGMMGVGKDEPKPIPQSSTSDALTKELASIKPLILHSQGHADRGRFFTQLGLFTQSDITVDAGLTMGGTQLVKALESLGYKSFMRGDDTETLSKMVDGRSILIDVGMGRGPDNTMITVDPADKDAYDAVSKVFAPVIGPTATSGSNLAPLDFNEARKIYDEYNPPAP